MTIIAELPPEPAVVFTLPSADAQGDAGISVSELAEEVTRHWQERAEWILANSEEDPYGYNSVPLKIVGTVKVRYKFIGEIDPMPYEWDD